MYEFSRIVLKHVIKVVSFSAVARCPDCYCSSCPLCPRRRMSPTSSPKPFRAFSFAATATTWAWRATSESWGSSPHGEHRHDRHDLIVTAESEDKSGAPRHTEALLVHLAAAGSHRDYRADALQSSSTIYEHISTRTSYDCPVSAIYGRRNRGGVRISVLSSSSASA